MSRYIVVTRQGLQVEIDDRKCSSTYVAEYLVFDTRRNLYFDATGSFHAFRHYLHVPFSTIQEADVFAEEKEKELVYVKAPSKVP